MGLGMARPGAVISSLPAAAEDEGLTDDELVEGEEGLDDQFAGDDAAAEDEAAIAEGYESAADKQATETEASRQGWRPLAQYQGKPGGWKTAKEFVEAGKNYLPFVQKQLREANETNTRMANEIQQIRTEMATTREEMRRLLDYSRKADQTGYDRAVRDLKDQQREAVANGDTSAYDKIEEQITQMATAREEAQGDEPAPVPRPSAPAPRTAAVRPEYDDFINANPWYMSDRVLNAAMIEAHNDVIRESPAMALADQLERAKESVMEQFPKKFGITPAARRDDPPPPRRPAPPLRPSGRVAPPAGGRTGIDSIADPSERSAARAGFASAKRSMPNLTEAEYLAVFQDPHADVLEVIQTNKRGK